MFLMPDGTGTRDLVVGLIPQSDTIFAVVLAANVSQQIAIPSSVPGSLTSGTFQAAETVTQTVSGATGRCMAASTATNLYLGAVTGTPTQYGQWVGGTSNAVWNPTSLPLPANRVLFAISGNNDFYMKFVNAAIAVPGSNVIDGTAPELNPLLRMCNGKSYVSLVSAATSCVLTMAFYQ